MTDTPATTFADLAEQAREAAELMRGYAAQMRRDMREIYRMLGLPLPDSLRDK